MNNSESVRADVWLWAARFFKTRALAKQALDGGKVLANEQPCKPAKLLHVGDRLKIRRGEERFELAIAGLSAQRGSAAQAQALYQETETSQAARAALRDQVRLAGAAKPAGRPDKRARRLIRNFKDGT